MQIEIPKELVEQGTVAPGEVYQIAVLPTKTKDAADDTSSSPAEGPEPPVNEGEIRTVTIDTLGDQGDGITRIERGYVVIVPDAEPDEEVTVEIDTVQSNVAFASVVERSK
nr:TRAM domain-containing protein [Halalkalicoccus jeotgali]